jgi:hypothetical protein
MVNMRTIDSAAKIWTYSKTIGHRSEVHENLVTAGTPLYLFYLANACSNGKELT